MTEAEWLTTDDRLAILSYAAPRASERRNRLYLCAVARRIDRWFAVPDVVLAAIEVAERYADGRATENELQSTNRTEFRVALDAPEADQDASARMPQRDAAALVHCCLYLLPPDQRAYAPGVRFPWQLVVRTDPNNRSDGSLLLRVVPSTLLDGSTEDLRDRRLVDCVYGNPFRPLTINTAWQTPTATAVARAIYDSKQFHDLPVLADALEDAGCDAADLLAHCRTSTDHARGCWALDAVLGLS